MNNAIYIVQSEDCIFIALSPNEILDGVFFIDE